jgi:hypothetical protein
MEGINYLCLFIYLCPVSILIGVGVFFLAQTSSRKIITKWFGNKKSWISIPIAIILAVSIAYTFFYFQFAPAFPGYYHPKKRPRTEDIIGKWVATSHSKEYIAELGYTNADPILTLHNTEEFTTSDFPDILFFHHNQILYSGEGKWELVRGFQGDWQIELVFYRINPPWYPDPPLSGPTPCPGLSVPCEGLHYNFELWHRKPPYLVFSYIGGELGPNIYYERLSDIYE